MKTPRTFVAALAKTTFPMVFNPYSDHCPTFDRKDASRVRRQNLVGALESAIDFQVETMWIARDLGYRGGRRTGIPLTDEVHLARAAALFGCEEFKRATHGPIVAERTAAVVWQGLADVGSPVVLWNIFPFHPHEPYAPFSNRCHSRAEREATWPFLLALIAMICPREVIAIGRDASAALAELSVPVKAVRHPSYGGQTEFLDGVRKLARSPRSATT